MAAGKVSFGNSLVVDWKSEKPEFVKTNLRDFGLKAELCI
jgi:hypothetical protein